MNRISQEYYFFLTDTLGCPYQGHVEGLGKVLCQPVLGISETPSSGATNVQGTFLSTNYVSVITPEPEQFGYDAEQTYKIEQFIKDRISQTNSDGSVDFYDVSNKKHYKLAKGASVDIKVVGEQVYIKAKDANTILEYQTDLRLYKEDLDNAQIPFGKIIFDGIGEIYGYTQFKLSEGKYVKGRPKVINGAKRQTKIKAVHNTKKYIKQKTGIKITTKNSVIVDKTMPKLLKRGGKVLGWTSVYLLVSDIYKSRSFKASHALDLTMLGVCAIPPFGWVVGLSYFAADVIVMGVNYYNTGSAKNIGDYLNEYLDENGVKDGVLLDLDPHLDNLEDWINNSFIPFFTPQPSTLIY